MEFKSFIWAISSGSKEMSNSISKAMTRFNCLNESQFSVLACEGWGPTACPKTSVIICLTRSSILRCICCQIGNDIDLTEIENALNNKVDKVSGKQLSTNDYTTTEKQKLAGIANQATKTTVENVLTSSSTTNALSAAQGKQLKDLIDALSVRVEALETPAA